MPTQKITKRAVDALHCPKGKDRVFLWDDALRGFGVAAFPSGKKVYVAQYRQGGRSRRMNVGQHGRLTPVEARSMAKKVLGAVEGGADPIEQRRGARGARTLKEVANEFLRVHVAPKKKPRTHEEYQRLVTLHILPALGARKLVDIKKVDVSRLHAKMQDRPGAANRTVALISNIWNWAAARDEVAQERNPVKGLERYPEQPSERYLTPDELGRLGDALRLAETTGIPWEVNAAKPTAKHLPKTNRATVVDPYAVAAIRLLIFTGARLREILHAKWENVDRERGLLLLPDSKTGKKTIYLSDVALSLLRGLTPVQDRAYIVPGSARGKAPAKGRKDAPRADLKKPWAAISRAGGLGDVRIHDLRHTFAATGAGASLGLPMIGKLLGHSQPATTARYAHLAADPMHRAANLISDQISAAMDRAPRETRG